MTSDSLPFPAVGLAAWGQWVLAFPLVAKVPPSSGQGSRGGMTSYQGKGDLGHGEMCTKSLAAWGQWVLAFPLVAKVPPSSGQGSRGGMTSYQGKGDLGHGEMCTKSQETGESVCTPRHTGPRVCPS